MIRGLAVRAMPVVLAATAVVLGACTSDTDSDGSAGGGDSAVSESSTEEPTYSPEAGEVVTLEQDQKWATLEQGRYAVQVISSMLYEVDVPDRWRVYQGRFLNSPPQENTIFFVSSAPKSSTELPQHPCDDPTGTRVGPSVSDLANGLRDQPVLQVSKPDPVTVDGHDGLYVEVRIPETVDSSTCVDDTVALFSTGSADWGWTEGFVGRWWILKVGGERVVINAQCGTACADDDLDILTTMAESVTFTRPK